MATQWPMRSFWVTAVVTDDTLLHSEPGTTQMSLLLNLVTSTKAHEYAASLGLIDNMKVCDQCGSTMYLAEKMRNKAGICWVCKTTGCDNVKNVRDHSFLHSSLEIEVVLRILFLWATDSTTVRAMQELKISPNTVISWYKKIRGICRYDNEKYQVKLGGHGKFVEIDESWYLPGKNGVGRRKRFCRWMVGAMERHGHLCRIQFVHNRTKETLLPVIQDWTLPGSTICTDCFKSYDSLGELEAVKKEFASEGKTLQTREESKPQYDHYTVNHKRNFVTQRPPTDPLYKLLHTQSQEGSWRLFKDYLRRVMNKGRDTKLALTEEQKAIRYETQDSQGHQVMWIFNMDSYVSGGGRRYEKLIISIRRHVDYLVCMATPQDVSVDPTVEYVLLKYGPYGEISSADVPAYMLQDGDQEEQCATNAFNEDTDAKDETDEEFQSVILVDELKFLGLIIGDDDDDGEDDD